MVQVFSGAPAVDNDTIQYNSQGKLTVLNPKVKVVSFTRDISLASGNQAVTGVGFTPKVVLFFVSVAGTPRGSWGGDDSTTPKAIYSDTNGTDLQVVADQSIRLGTATDIYEGKVDSLDSDGFTVAWTKTGTPTGTATIQAVCIG